MMYRLFSKVAAVTIGVVVAIGAPAQICDPDTTRPDGGVTSPFDGECFGDTVPFVFVADDFRDTCDAALDRRYDPVPVPEMKLKTTPPLVEGKLGSSVATHGEVVAATFLADRSTRDERTTVQVFERSDHVWIPTQRLTASDGFRRDVFGRSIAIHEDWIAVGATGMNDFGFATGAVYVFRRDDDGWSEVGKLLDPEAGTQGYFGFQIVMDEHTLAVATDDLITSPTSGAVVVF
ncbi:MAG: FG-GAP repeat protein, partial [Planctomycetota bacterium]|nr:FG-GAP repeat protein [Planctomycetota bacterium]